MIGLVSRLTVSLPFNIIMYESRVHYTDVELCRSLVFIKISVIIYLSPVKLLISYGGCVNEKDCNGNTPLHLGELIVMILNF